MRSESSYRERKEAINQLPKDPYLVLSVCAVYGFPMAEERIFRLLNGISASPEHQKLFTARLVSTQVRWLEDRGYLNYQGNLVYILDEWREPAARHFFLRQPKALTKLVSALIREEKFEKSLYYYRFSSTDVDRQLRRLRLLLFANQPEDFKQIQNALSSSYYISPTQQDQITEKIIAFFLPPDLGFFSALSPEFGLMVLVLNFNKLNLWEEGALAAYRQFIIKLVQKQPDGNTDALNYLFLAQSLSGLKLGQQLQDIRVPRNTLYEPGLNGLAALLKRDWQAAESAFQPFQQQCLGGRVGLPYHFWSLIFVLYRCKWQQMQDLGDFQEWAALAHRTDFHPLFKGLSSFLDFSFGDEETAIEAFEKILATPNRHPVEDLFLLLYAYWMGVTLEEDFVQRLAPHLQQWEKAGLHWLAGETANALALVFPKQAQRARWQALADDIKETHGFHYLVDLLPRQQAWERALLVLEQVSSPQSTNTYQRADESKRLVWFVDFESETLEAKEQKVSKRGTGWTPGRVVDESSLFRKDLKSLTAKDTEVIEAAIKPRKSDYTHYNYYSLSNYDLEVDFKAALYHLAGHPLIFLASGGRQQLPLTLVQSKPELLIIEEQDEIQLRFHPASARSSGYFYEKETPTRYRVFKISESEAQVARTLKSGLDLPLAAKPRLEAIAGQLREKINVQSPMDLAQEGLETVAGDPRPCLHLLPMGEGFKLEFYVKPLIDEPHYFKPGEGLPTRILPTTKGRVACQRALAEETQLADAVIEACPTLANQISHDYEWLLDDTQACLQALLELHPLRQAGEIRLEHPKGEKVRLGNILDSNQLSIRIQKQRDWFNVEGELQLDENEVLQFQALLDHIKNSESNFVELRNGEFIALTETFRERLNELDGMLQQRGKKLELSTLAGLRMAELGEAFGELQMDQAWSDSIARIEKAQRIKPRLPKSFQAELRPYQLEGFRWMMRLAEWGVGACLADDMGLGKTVQALAALSVLAEKGPSLVLAPASVTRNWEKETLRFAPALRPQLLSSSKEQDLIQSVGPGDLLLVSYGLLPFVDEALAERAFTAIVLDEAQAIKNAATKRSKTVMELQADFRLATTGTPIENHLGELWNLFRFLNPGLLGSSKSFNEKFAKPIAQNNDVERREHLRRLIQPFILRRRKSEVLSELPEKTEVILNVELSIGEKSFYEALRRKALEAIESSDDQSKRFTVLAQLTALRQAACHPRLLFPNSKLPSAKLELVGKTITELLENGHKALVFSQFVKHLRLVEEWVKNEGIAYQYLDGQTPGAKREAAVSAFQSGDGQLFLISLKAGGTGLNLTEADYVLHLDPWWNPAVEDQASDRAHRIGQQRPVTVYRFVSEHTIEEKIVKLHQEKRELADQLLSGTDVSAKLSVEQMLDLLRE